MYIAPAAIVDGAMPFTIRPARTSDVPVIRKLIDSNVESGRLLSKATVTLYEDVQEFCVAELSADATAGGCGALHVMWEDLAEIRTVAVREDCQNLGIGHAIVDTLLGRARAVGVSRVFCLTFAVDTRLTPTDSSRSVVLPWPQRCTASYCAPMTRAWRSFSTWNG